MVTRTEIKNIHSIISTPTYVTLLQSKSRKDYQKHFLEVLKSNKFPDTLYIDLSYYCTYYNYKILC